jgi:hypothetical protein
MATAYTTLLGLALPVTGELNGTWGDVVNDSITELVEDAIAGSATASVTSADWTLTTTGSGAANQARSAILIPTGTPGVSRNIIAPSSSKAYIVDNQSNAAVVIKGAATTGVTIATNTAALVAWDGADFVLVAQDLANATGTLPVAKGGTGQTTYTDGQLLIGNSSGNTLAKATLTQGSGVTITNGAGAITIAATGSGGTVTSVAVSGGTTGLTVSGSPITTSGTITLAGTLAVANGGTGITSFGSGVATFLATPSSANLAAAVTDETGTGALVFATSPTLASPTFNDGYTEEVFAVSGTTPALSPADGSIQTWTLSGNSTPTAGTWNAGQSITLMIDDDSAFTVTWTSLAVTWKTDGGVAPTLNTTGFTVITLWKVGTTIYGARVGDA